MGEVGTLTIFLQFNTALRIKPYTITNILDVNPKSIGSIDTTTITLSKPPVGGQPQNKFTPSQKDDRNQGST